MPDAKSAQLGAETLPRFAILPGRGKCLVLSYDGNGYFTVMTNRDAKVFAHRDRLIFTNK